LASFSQRYGFHGLQKDASFANNPVTHRHDTNRLKKLLLLLAMRLLPHPLTDMRLGSITLARKFTVRSFPTMKTRSRRSKIWIPIIMDIYPASCAICTKIGSQCVLNISGLKKLKCLLIDEYASPIVISRCRSPPAARMPSTARCLAQRLTLF
jgi:hypothetical protein